MPGCGEVIAFDALRNSFQVLLGDRDLAAEAGVLANVIQFGRLLRLGVQQLFNAGPIGSRPVLVLFGPDGRGLDDKGFTIRIEGVGHDERLE
jgi:hypothetical protein